MQSTVHRSCDLVHCWERYPQCMQFVESDHLTPPADPFDWAMFFRMRDQTDHLVQYCTSLGPSVTRRESSTEPNAAPDVYTADEEPDDAMDIEPLAPVRGNIVPPLVCRRPIRGPLISNSNVLDTFLLAMLTGHGVRLVNTQDIMHGFDIYDYKRYYDFSQDLLGQQDHHKNVAPDVRIKALLLWADGDTRLMLKCVHHNLPHPCCRLTIRKPAYRQKIADRYNAMCVFIKPYL